MPDIDAIRERESFEAWLRETQQPREACVALAHRAALRAAPCYLRYLPPERYEPRFSAISILRSLLTSSAKGLAPKIRQSSKGYVERAIDYSSTDEAAYAAGDAASAAYSAAHAEADAATDARVTAFAASAASYAAAAADAAGDDDVGFWEAYRRDCQALTQGMDPMSMSLWPGEEAEVLGTILDRQKKILDGWANAGPLWRFWHDWYRAALLGQPMDIDLLTEIALIPSDMWEEDDEAVNARIADIYERHQLLDEVLRIKAERDELRHRIASAEQRSHNMPPELIDAPEDIAKPLIIVWECLDDAEDELDKPEPDRARLASIGAAIVSAMSKILAYCAKVNDTFLMEAAKSAGKVAGPLLLGWLAINGERLVQLGEWIKRFATSL